MPQTPAPPRTNFAWNRFESPFLYLKATLRCGQTFRWRQADTGIWWGTIDQTAVALWQEPANPHAPLYWQTFPAADQETLLSDYLRLHVPLSSLFEEWIQVEPRILPALTHFEGVRILRQPPLECFFSFICSSCNTVIKIERSVYRLATRYGERIEVGGERLFCFPTLEELAYAKEEELRADLWGYRAPRVIALARELLHKEENWLEALRRVPHTTAKQELIRLHGIGEKLADCISLFSLDKDEAIPVDTHVRQLTCRLYRPDLEPKSLTPRVYAEIVEEWQKRFGAYAGWAHQYLFLGELSSSSTLSLPS
jgi:8-oxoguanine DNA-glycosylase Ogg